MRYAVKCATCGTIVWVRGSFEPDTNALELSDRDSAWADQCQHLKDGGEFDIVDSEVEDDEP